MPTEMAACLEQYSTAQDSNDKRTMGVANRKLLKMLPPPVDDCQWDAYAEWRSQ